MFVKQIKRRFHYEHFNHSCRRFPFCETVCRFTCERSSKEIVFLSQLCRDIFLGEKKQHNSVKRITPLSFIHRAGKFTKLTTMIMVKNVCLINRESDMYRCKFAQEKGGSGMRKLWKFENLFMIKIVWIWLDDFFFHRTSPVPSPCKATCVFGFVNKTQKKG